jgi:hypothetical protein
MSTICERFNPLGVGDEDVTVFVTCGHGMTFNVEQCDGLTLTETDQPTTAPEIDEKRDLRKYRDGMGELPRCI